MAVMIILFVLLNVSFRTCCIEPVIDSCSVLAVAFSISPMSSLPLFLHCLPSYFATVFSPIPPLSSLSFLLCHFLHCLPPIPPLYILPFHHCLSALSFIVFSAIHQLFFLPFPYGFPPIPPLVSLPFLPCLLSHSSIVFSLMLLRVASNKKSICTVINQFPADK